MPIVVDASAASTLVLSDESKAFAAALLEALAVERMFVPSLWWFETRNAVVVNERRRRLDRPAADTALVLLGALPAEIDDAPDETSILALARAHRLTFYDAAYLELAQRQAATLATLDRALAKAAASEGVGLLA
jgi:predicted nucleic acid-binding protein